MTATDKPVRRITVGTYRFAGASRRLVAQLGEGDVIILREQGRRYRAALPLDWCYRQAVRLRVEQERADKGRGR